MQRLLVLAVTVGAVAGCDALDSRTPGVCGNDVLDEREDCDGRVRPEQAGDGVTCAAPGADHECRYVCTGAASCPAGWGCGSDGVCRFASGRYELAPAVTSALGTVSVGDVDGDGRAELLVGGLDEARTLVSSGDGSFTIGASVPLAWFKPRAEFGDLDGDGRTDLIAGSNYGIVEFRGQPSGALAPFVHPRFRAPMFPQTRSITGTLQTSPPLAQTEFPEQHLVVIAQDPGTGQLQVQFRDQHRFAAEGDPVNLGVATLEQLFGATCDLDRDGLDELALTRVGAMQLDVLVPVVSTVGQPRVTSVTRQTVSLPAPAAYGVLSADADGDSTRDVLINIDGDHVAVAPGLGGGTLGPAVIAPEFDTVFPGTSMSIGLPFAAIDLGAAGQGWVTRVGVVFGGASPALLDAPTVAWTGAITGDFNRDGREDIAAFAFGRPGIDLWLQSPSHLFGHARIPTAFPPLGLVPGDFDGDGTLDLALLEGVGDGPYQAAVCYGGPQGLGPPVAIGSWRQVDAFNVASLQPTPEIRRDATSDLLVQGVLASSPTDELSLTYLTGTAQRQMLGAYITRTETPVPAFITGDFSLVGNFGSPGGYAPDSIRDIALLGYGAVDPAQPSQAGLFAAVAVSTGDGNLIDPAFRLTASPRVVPDIDNAPIGPGIGISQCSAWQAADLDGDGLDEMIGLTSSSCASNPQIFIGRPDGAGGISFRSDVITLDQQLLGAPTRVDAVDVDGDGQRELVVSANVSVTVYFRSPAGAYEPVRLPDDLGAPISAVAINADDDPQLEMVALVVAPEGTDNLVIFELGADRRSFSTKGRAGTSPYGRLYAVDLDGDRVDDLVVQGVDPNSEVLRVLLAVPN